MEIENLSGRPVFVFTPVNIDLDYFIRPSNGLKQWYDILTCSLLLGKFMQNGSLNVWMINRTCKSSFWFV